MENRFDVIVCGLGIMGSATLATLAARGKHVLGLERFDLGHAMGSSHGISRIIRIAYFEGAAYVPLVRRAATLWKALGETIGEAIVFQTGTLECAPAGSALIEQSRASCLAHGLAHTVMDARETMRRFPAFRLPADYAGLFQPDGGFLASDRALNAYQMLAIEHGAEIRSREPLVGFEPQPDGGVTVRTVAGSYHAKALVLAAGAWMGELVPQLKSICLPERQVLGWFQPRKPELFAMERFPASILWTPAGHFFHFPLWGAPGFKIGLHRHRYEQGPADQLDRQTDETDEDALREGLRFGFPEADGTCLRLSSCLYTMTPDEHFILDRLPGAPQVIVASPCSGHGFKFASVFGEMLADLAMEREPGFDLSMFALSRFGAKAGA
jgi:sarcosine oxidase